MDNVIGDLPLQNNYDSVLDLGISKGTTNWQVFGSRKPNHKAYTITHIFEMKFDEDDGEFQMETLNVNEYSKNLDLMEFSVRNTKCQKLPFKTAFIPQYEQLEKGSAPQAFDVSPRNNAIQTIPCMSSFSFSTYELIKINQKYLCYSVKVNQALLHKIRKFLVNYGLEIFLALLWQ